MLYTKVLYTAEGGIFIADFIKQVVKKRPKKDICYFLFNDTLVQVDPKDNASTLYQKWTDLYNRNYKLLSPRHLSF